MLSSRFAPPDDRRLILCFKIEYNQKRKMANRADEKHILGRSFIGTALVKDLMDLIKRCTYPEQIFNGDFRRP